MRRLKIIDLNTGDQPIYNEIVRLQSQPPEILTIRLYIKSLFGHHFVTQSDAEVIVRLRAVGH
jgi:asparagine synthetase B (glutamine-hydrolysing)